MATPTSKSQRLVNLVICLMSTTSHLSADQIRRMVQGYEDCTTDQAFLRRFERDKKELRQAGVPIDQGAALTSGLPAGYRISAADYRLPDIHLSPEQAGVLGVAANVWRSGERGAEASGALAKLTAAGITPVADRPLGLEVSDPHELGVAATLAEAIADGAVVTFTHTAAGATAPVPRRVEPWWTGSRNGHWYLVGFDLDRDQPRTYRLIRVASVDVTADRRSRAVPPHGEVTALLDRAIARVNPEIDATVWVAHGHGAELRSRAHSGEPGEHRGRPGDVLGLRGPLATLAALVAGQSGDAVALAPDDLRERVVSVLTSAVDAGARR